MADEQRDGAALTAPTAAGAPPYGAPVQGIAVTVSAELGRAWATLEELLVVGEQSLIELDKTVSAPVELYVSGRRFARGEVVTVNERFGVRITEIVNSEAGAP